MATIALIWELGSDYGHIGRFLPIALALRERGHRPVMMLRDISRAHAMLGPWNLEYLQAPLWLPPVKGLPAPLNFSESLFLFGFLNPEGLLSIAHAWRQAFKWLKPDLLLFDHAPTALLAARGLALPRLITGNSFAVPPAASPLPVYRWWEPKPSGSRLADSEQRLLLNANSVLRALEAPPLEQVSDLFQAESIAITGLPALDVYGPRSPEQYIGPINTTAQGESPQWPGERRKRIFAYLKPHYAGFEPVLDALARSDASVLIFAQGVARQLVQRFQSGNLQFRDSRQHMGLVREQCNLAICHAGGTVDVMLEAGKPLLLLPTQMEQSMTSKRVEQVGCGLTYRPDQPPNRLNHLLTSLLDDVSWSERAVRFAKSHAHFRQELAMDRLMERCQALL